MLAVKHGLYSIRIEMKDGGRGHATGVIVLLDGQILGGDPPAWAAAAAIATSPQRRPRLPQKLPSDILTLQSKRHLNLVATAVEGSPNSITFDPLNVLGPRQAHVRSWRKSGRHLLMLNCHAGARR
jgi:hypothetical protein